MIIRWNPSRDQLDAVAHDASRTELTYEDIGATRDQLPAGFRHDRYHRSLGLQSFDRARECLRRWQAHRGAGVEVAPADAVLEEGETVVVALGVGPLVVAAPCRIVYVIDEPDAFGFAYGTLTGHPEAGEEAFVLRRESTGETVFEVTAFSRPADVLARFGGPLTRAIQRRTTDHYLSGLERCARTLT